MSGEYSTSISLFSLDVTEKDKARTPTTLRGTSGRPSREVRKLLGPLKSRL